jgi:hypothetical protein
VRMGTVSENETSICKDLAIVLETGTNQSRCCTGELDLAGFQHKKTSDIVHQNLVSSTSKHFDPTSKPTEMEMRGKQIGKGFGWHPRGKCPGETPELF